MPRRKWLQDIVKLTQKPESKFVYNRVEYGLISAEKCVRIDNGNEIVNKR